MSRVEATRMMRKPGWICGGCIAVYCALLLSQINHGIASLDAHGIIRVVQTLVDNDKIDISRPPGHPTTEFYIFGAIGWLLYLFAHAFSERIYLLGQAIAAAATLGLFYELLRRLNLAPPRACIAVLCLAFSAQFFANAVDGEEFIYALFFALLAIRLLIPGHPIGFVRLFMSTLAFALATGCRPEMGFAVVIYPIYFFCSRADGRRIVFTIAAIVLTSLIVWLPIITVGARVPYGSSMTLKQAVLGGGYKLVFQCFGLAIFVALLVVLVREILHRPWRGAFPRNFVGALACVLPLLFFMLFFCYATKPAYVLIALPLLLITTAESRMLLFVIAMFTAIELFVRIDIFRDRQLTSPFLTWGSSLAVIRQKPFYRLEYLRRAAEQCDAEPTVVIADAARWDFEYHVARGTFPAEEKRSEMNQIPVFIPSGASACAIMPRDAAYANETIKNWRARGYKFKIDVALYQRVFARYDITAPNESSGFNLFSVRQ